MIEIFDFFAEIIASYDIKRYRQYGGAYEFVAVIYFKDNSSLHIRDYVFIDGNRKYAFHWQDQHKDPIRRWDNAEHHQHLATFPFHVHTPSTVDESPSMTLRKALEYIKTQFPTNWSSSSESLRL